MSLDGGSPFVELLTARRRWSSAGRPAARCSTRRAATRRSRTRNSRAYPTSAPARSCRWPRRATGATGGTGGRCSSRGCLPGQLHEALPGRHGAEPLAVRRRRRRGDAAHRRLRGHQQAPDAVERARVLPERPGRHDEPVVDGRGGRRSEAAHTARRLDAQSPSLSNGRSPTSSAPTCAFTTSSHQDRAVPIRLVSDFDHLASAGSRRRSNGSPPRTSRRPATAWSSPRADSCLSPPRTGPHRRGDARPRCATAWALHARRQVAADPVRRIRRVEFWRVPANGIGERGSSPRTGRCCAGMACRRPTAPGRALRQGSAALALRHDGEDAEAVAKSDEAVSTTCAGRPTASGWPIRSPAATS